MASILFFNVVFFLFQLAVGLKPTPTGLFPPIFTPFGENGQLNLEILPEYAVHLKNIPVDGVLVAGTSGEGGTLSVYERKVLLAAWIKIGKPLGLKVIIHIGGMPLPHVLEMARYAKFVGADGILTLPELYYKPKSTEEAVEYLKLVAEAAPSLPLFYYDNPLYSGVRLNVAELFALATKTIPNFKGVKCHFPAALEITASNDLRDDQTIFVTGPITMASNLLMGLNSSMTFVHNVFPELMLEIRQAVSDSNVARARDLQMMLNRRMAVINFVGDVSGDIVPHQKVTMEMVTGIKVGNTRDPIVHPSAEQREYLRNELQQLGVRLVSK